MVFDTKVAILILDDLAVWQKLNVTAFPALGAKAPALEAKGPSERSTATGTSVCAC